MYRNTTDLGMLVLYSANVLDFGFCKQTDFWVWSEDVENWN